VYRYDLEFVRDGPVFDYWNQIRSFGSLSARCHESVGKKVANQSSAKQRVRFQDRILGSTAVPYSRSFYSTGAEADMSIRIHGSLFASHPPNRIRYLPVRKIKTRKKSTNIRIRNPVYNHAFYLRPVPTVVEPIASYRAIEFCFRYLFTGAKNILPLWVRSRERTRHRSRERERRRSRSRRRRSQSQRRSQSRRRRSQSRSRVDLEDRDNLMLNFYEGDECDFEDPGTNYTPLLVQRCNGTTAGLGWVTGKLMRYVHANLPLGRLASVRTTDSHWGRMTQFVY
jgi:hypothetical protein